MKKIVSVLAILSFGLSFSQKNETKKTEPNNKGSKLYPKMKLDSSRKDEQQNDSQSRFYKNIDDQKASKYKMLNKKPGGEFLELPSEKPKLFPAEVPNDSILLKKKKK